MLKTYDFVDISNATISTVLGGSTTASPPIVVVILRQQLDYVIVDYGRADHPPGLRHEKSSCISLTSKNCESPSSWRFLLNP
jgi:hypothetical protein